MINPDPCRIALSIIFGNSEKTIGRFLESFAPVMDYLVAFRAIGTAEADGTADLINEFCTSRHIPFSIGVYDNESEFPHVDNFGKARQESWSEAEDTGLSHLMWADCDDTLADGAAQAIREACSSMEEEVLILPYHVRGNDKQVVMRERIIRNGGFSAWDGAIHETLKFSRDVKYRIVKGGIILHEPDPLRDTSAPRNLSILSAQTKDSAKNFYYLAQEAFESGRIADLKKWGLAALSAPGLASIERYETLLNLAQVEMDPEAARSLASRAYHEMPDRREALALMANFHLIDGRAYDAHALAKTMIQMPVPPRSYWSLNREWYDWKGFYLYTQTLRLIGKTEDAAKMEWDLFHKSGQNISIVHATRGRPDQALAARELWLSRAETPAQVEHIFCLDGDDATSTLLRGFRHSNTPGIGGGCVAAWNAGAKVATGKILIQMSDDWIPPVGWDKAILDRIGNWAAPSVLAVSDAHRTDRLLCMAILTRARYIDQGFLLHPEFKSVFSDDYFTEKAYQDNVVIEARDLIFFHNNPFFTSAPADKTFAESNSPERYKEGQEILERLSKSK